MVNVPVDPAITDLKVFIWHLADKEAWDSIHIEGEFAERKDAAGVVVTPARSKNKMQERIMKAKNWADHPVSADVAANGIAPGARYMAKLAREESEAAAMWHAENKRVAKATADEWSRKIKASVGAAIAKVHAELGSKEPTPRKKRSPNAGCA